MTVLCRRALSLTLCALTIAWLVVQPRSGAPDAAKTPLAVTRLYRMNDAGTALLPMNARTLTDLTGVPAGNEGSGPSRVTEQLDPYFKHHLLPSGCRTKQIVRIVTGFVTAFNHDDKSGLARYLALKNLSAYAVGGSLKNGTYVPEINTSNGAKVLAYIARRHQHHECLQMLALKVVPYPRPGYYGPVGYIGINPRIERTADDLVAARNVAGVKGLMNCKEQTIDRWIQDGKYIKPPASAGWGAL